MRDEVDNCPDIRNGDQRNTDGLSDGGDACDPDMDEDGFPNDDDTCEQIANPNQSVNPCAEDPDGDGIPTFDDNCFDVFNPDQFNNDARLQYSDELGDACDPDDDGDGVFDDRDNCPLIENPDQTDADGDGRGYLCDADDTPRATGTGGTGGAGGGGTAQPDSKAPVVTLDCPEASVRDGRGRARRPPPLLGGLHREGPAPRRRIARRLRLPRNRVARRQRAGSRTPPAPTRSCGSRARSSAAPGDCARCA